ncbi:VCBS domain-containing protein, partial [Chitinimonas sp. PSY-7]|uniref:VCBS domain-containing protein n=1 Tax=Chitinimonas sp. PSY-7 TaxID=3459088 RepID=UPI0040402021
GKWTYTLDNRAELLKEGEVRDESFTVTLNDGSTSTVSIHVTGTNDVAVIGKGVGDSDSGRVTEDGVLVSRGKLTVTDADHGEAELKPVTLTNAYGTFTVGKDGNWQFELNNAAAEVQRLQSGETVSQVFTVESLDGTWADVTIIITGTEESATAGVGSVQEDTTLRGSGTLVASGGATFVSETLTGLYGSLTIAADGQWTYKLANADAVVQGLAAGKSDTEVFSVTLSDGATTTVTINVAGVNDDATISGTATGSVIEDSLLQRVQGVLTVADVDQGQDVFQKPGSLVGTYGSFTFNEQTGEWSYAVDPSKIQFLNENERVTDTLQVKSEDGTATQDIVVT